MANTVSQLTKRGINLIVGVLMFMTSLFLVIKVHASLFDIMYTFNPYPFYFLGFILGGERIFYAISGSSKLFNLLTGGGGEYSSLTQFAIFLMVLGLGIYILIYTVAFTIPMIMVMNALNGLSYLFYSLIIFKAWHM